MLIGSKLDLEDAIAVEDEYAVTIKNTFNMIDYFKISSKNGFNVAEVFDALVKELMKKSKY